MICKNCKHYTRTQEFKAISVKQFNRDGLTCVCWENFEYRSEDILPERKVVTLPIEWVDSWKPYLNSLDAIELPNRFSGTCDFLDQDFDDINEKNDNLMIVVSDDHGLYMHVGENFGCIHFRQKEKEADNDVYEASHARAIELLPKLQNL